MHGQGASWTHDEVYLEVDGDGEGLAALGLGHVAAVLARSVLLQLLLRHEHDELAVQARLVVAQVVLVPEVVCTATELSFQCMWSSDMRSRRVA